MINNYAYPIDYTDSILIVDNHFKILNTYRLNPRFDENVCENIYSNYIDKQFFEVYPDIKESDSSIVECINQRKIVFRENQIFRDVEGNVFNTKNITIPIIRKGKVVGAVELSKDITSIENSINLESKAFKKDKINNETNYTNESIKFEDIITINNEMLDNIEKAKVYAKSDSPVLIYGETGTGKEMFVQAMVNYSNRKNKKFVIQNCAAIPENLFETMLFGTEAGAYTGAKKNSGLFEIANGGTLFLDEINSMPMHLQAKLLRVLQDRKIRAVGSVTEKKVDVKIIAAMNIGPMDAIKNNFLREDLFYRLSSGTLRMIPLRERKEDIPIYLNKFISMFNNIYNKNVSGVSDELLKFFMKYEWKGNVRELKHIIESMVSIANCNIFEINQLPIYMKTKIKKDTSNKYEISNLKSPTFESLNETISKVERDLIIKTLTYTRGNLTKAGKLLKIPRQTLKYKINKNNIDTKKYK